VPPSDGNGKNENESIDCMHRMRGRNGKKEKMKYISKL
jgi:hypothetical protein